MSENLLKLFAGPIESIEGAERHALRLYLEIEKHHGEQEARRIFTNRGRKPTKKEVAERKRFKILERYDFMPEPNVMELARQLEVESKTLPPDEQITPRGSKTQATIDHHIRSLLKRRKEEIAAGTWEGPPWDWSNWSPVEIKS
jgi:hypothetical protein